MTSKPSRAVWPRGFGRGSGALPRLLLAATLASVGAPGAASGLRDDPTAIERPRPARQAMQAHAPSATVGTASRDAAGPQQTADGFCVTLAAAAASNDLPVDFFTRLIWRESRFKADAISRKGAQGVAQFMPATARASGLGDPFNPREAVAKSGELLRALRREFGNLGLAAAAYNAGPKRVHDWLGGRRPLPQETQAYVRFVTGRPVEAWAAGEPGPPERRFLEAVPCNLPASAPVLAAPDAEASKIAPKIDAAKRSEPVKPWGVEVVGGPTPAKALARYREWLPKYAAIVGDRTPHVVMHGIMGNMGSARVRIGEETRAGATKLCAALRTAGTYCDVLRMVIPGETTPAASRPRPATSPVAER
ncbi:MAG TPA: lytic transglycosylase domain-containing protein [Xanthobacteraceae bacterium]|nr:lytic transglycosylase domain-containing protein [Xanthobacteraceae bacterium]